MIRINLLVVERERPKRGAGFQLAQKLALACSTVLVLGAAFIGWRYMVVTRDSAKLDEEIAAAQKETVRLHAIIQQVQQFEERKGQLQQRVALIEQLRSGQTGPVHMLDQVSRALPPMLWLTEIKQTGPDVVVDGRCTTMTALSDFVANLEASGYFKRSVEIVGSQTEAQGSTELVRFSIRAQFQTPGGPPAPPPVVAASQTR